MRLRAKQYRKDLQKKSKNTEILPHPLTEKGVRGAFLLSMQPTSPKVVLFDMDGVLYDSMANHGIAWQRAMKEFGIHFTVEDSYATEGARGVDTIRKYAKAQLGKELTEEEAQKMYDLKAHYFHEMPEAKIFDGVTDLMKKIKDCGLKIGIVTGSAQRPLI